MPSNRIIVSPKANPTFKWLLRILLNLVLGLLIFAILSSAESTDDTPETDNAVELEPVVVTATKTPQRLKDTPVITNLITRSDIEATGAENIGEVLEHTAGIIIHRDGHGDGVQLQGLDSEYVLILTFGTACKPKLAPQLYTTSLLVFTVSIAVLTTSAELHQNTLTVDATDRENWAYINLTTGETVDIADPATSMVWDLGFKRTEIITNGGVSGPAKTGVTMVPAPSLNLSRQVLMHNES